MTLTRADEWSARAFSSRILDNRMGAWLKLVRAVAQRYMAPTYSVRYFQVWNELKGYYSPASNTYDYSTSPGKPGGANATHGSTYMYNRVYAQLLSVAHSMGIPSARVLIGGPYIVLDTWSSSIQSDPSSLVKAYGTFDQRSLDVLKYWLRHKSGAGFMTIDASIGNKDGAAIATATVAAAKFGDIVRWIRSLNPSRYPGARTLPIWLAEWYARPYGQNSDSRHSAAIKTYAMMAFLKAGGAVALSWGATAIGQSSPELWRNMADGGVEILPFYQAYSDFKTYFAPGVQLYNVTVTPPGRVDAVASDSVAMLVNMSAAPLIAAVDGRSVTLAPYEITVVRERA